jgi:hypothetical protein
MIGKEELIIIELKKFFIFSKEIQEMYLLPLNLAQVLMEIQVL